MFDSIENLKIISTLHRKNRTSNKIENRATHSFLIRVKGSVLYDFYDKTILANEGDIMFIPKGTSYEYRILSEDTFYSSINFEADFKDCLRPKCYPFENFYKSDYVSSHFSDMWNLGTWADKYKCISLFYELLSYLSSIENSTYSEKTKYEIIEPAIQYLKNNIYNCSLRVDKLHKLCGISNTYFRQIFVSRFSVTPQEYIVLKRLSHARTIFDSGDYDTVKEVALSVGYNDPLYFSKAYKKAYGKSPVVLKNPSDIN